MRCTQTKARSETKDGREEFWRKHNRKVGGECGGGHVRSLLAVITLKFSSVRRIHTYYSQYILRIPFSSSIFYPPPQPQHASQLLQVGYARGKPLPV